MLRAFWAAALFVVCTQGSWAQEGAKGAALPAAPAPSNFLEGKSLSVSIAARILDSEEATIWEANAAKQTMAGRPVSIKMVGSNIVVVAQFTPYLQADGKGHVLVAQGEVWIAGQDGMVRYHSSIQTIAMVLGEPVLFYPLGNEPGAPGNDRIEVRIEVQGDPGAGE